MAALFCNYEVSVTFSIFHESNLGAMIDVGVWVVINDNKPCGRPEVFL